MGACLINQGPEIPTAGLLVAVDSPEGCPVAHKSIQQRAERTANGLRFW